MATFIFDNSFESYDFGIHEKLTYNESEQKTIKDISKKYDIPKDEIYSLAYFVKTEGPPIDKYFSKSEKVETDKFFKSGLTIDSISFNNSIYGKQFTIVDADLIENFLKAVHIRNTFASNEGKKNIKKRIAKRLYNQLTQILKQKDYDTKIIIGLIFAEYKIGLYDEPIHTREEHKLTNKDDNYLNYLERNVRSFLTD